MLGVRSRSCRRTKRSVNKPRSSGSFRISDMTDGTVSAISPKRTPLVAPHMSAFEFHTVRCPASEGYQMRRREFISLAAGTMLAGPLSAQAQEPGRVYRLALVLPLGRDEPAGIAFLDELRVQGFVEGQNLVIIGGQP